MKEFKLDRPCVKCGYRDRPAGIDYKVGIFNEQTKENIGNTRIGEEIDDYLMRTCSRCGYIWAEECLNEVGN